MRNLPEFTRIVWVSQEARNVWRERFYAIAREANRVELETVIQGLRPIALPSFRIRDFNNLEIPQGLTAKILDVHGQANGYQSALPPLREGEPFSLRTVVGSEFDAKEFLALWEAKDQVGAGRLLGYPECCTSNFMQLWVTEGKLDFTWDQMGVDSGVRRKVVEPLQMLNIMYQKVGIRPFYHMPCSVHCEETAGIVEDYLELWHPKIRNLLVEVFHWPVEWSALHGAAEIRTPVCKIITDTNITSDEYVVQFPGEKLPDEAARGNRFPYCDGIDIYSNNGFTSQEAMNHSHEVVLLAASRARRIKSITDPGCGNGMLLHKLGILHPESRLHGIEQSPHGVSQGRRLFPDITFTKGDLFESYCGADLMLLMPGRLEERPDRAQEFVDKLNFRYLLLYGYKDAAHVVWDLKNKYWPQLKIASTVVDDLGVATLLERP